MITIHPEQKFRFNSAFELLMKFDFELVIKMVLINPSV